MEKPSIIRIFAQFLRLGLTAFGGPAMVPYIRALAVEKEQWLSETSFRLGMSVTQIIPGATAMQMAAYVGLRSRGGSGAVAAYIGFGLPAFLLMLSLSMLYFTAQDIPAVTAAFNGLQLIVVALVLNATINFARRYLDSLPTKLLACIAGVWLGLKGNPILALVAVCAVSVFIFRNDQAPPPLEHQESTGKPLLSAGLITVSLAGLLLFLLFIEPSLFDLGALMIKIDCFAFGGGYVSVPLMLHDVVEVRGWLDSAQFMDGIALGQITPGPIVMTGAFVGYAVAGIAGALVATICVFTPSLVFVCLATPFADKIATSPIARRVLKGSLITLVGLMAAVSARFGLAIDWGIAEALIAIIAFIAMRLGTDILWVVLCGAGASAILL